jgi:hypothetical protein
MTNPTISGQPAKASSPVCPNCGATLHAQAIVTSFNEPADWTSFYGEVGKRWVRCRGKVERASFTHFLVKANGRMTHRLAWYELQTGG